MPTGDTDSQATTPSGAVVAAAPRRTAGRYAIHAEIARGGMASVYLARCKGHDRDVALKELSVETSDDAALAERFALESEVAAGLSHPNVVTVFDCFESDSRSYIAMEYLEGGSLRAYAGRLSLEQIAGALEGVLAGLAHLEARGVVHRDIKPENLLVSADGRVKIADFGIAKPCGAALARLTTDGRTVGTPAYMAPEQAMGRAVGPLTDLYSVGVVAYELLVGELPFKNTDWSVLIQHVNEAVPAPRALRPDLAPELERWLLRLLEKDPAHRPASAQVARRELDECMVGLRGPHWRRAARLVPVPGAAQPRPLSAPEPPLAARLGGERELVGQRHRATAARAAGLPRRCCRRPVAGPRGPRRAWTPSRAHG